jgi:hypothetical protein
MMIFSFSEYNNTGQASGKDGHAGYSDQLAPILAGPFID